MLQDENPKGNKIPLEDIDPFTFSHHLIKDQRLMKSQKFYNI